MPVLAQLHPTRCPWDWEPSPSPYGVMVDLPSLPGPLAISLCSTQDRGPGGGRPGGADYLPSSTTGRTRVLRTHLGSHLSWRANWPLGSLRALEDRQRHRQLGEASLGPLWGLRLNNAVWRGG